MQILYSQLYVHVWSQHPDIGTNAQYWYAPLSPHTHPDIGTNAQYWYAPLSPHTHPDIGTNAQYWYAPLSPHTHTAPCTLSSTHGSGSLEEPPPGQCSGDSDGLGGHVGIDNGMGHEVSHTLVEGSMIVVLWGERGCHIITKQLRVCTCIVWFYNIDQAKLIIIIIMDRHKQYMHTSIYL